MARTQTGKTLVGLFLLSCLTVPQPLVTAVGGPSSPSPEEPIAPVSVTEPPDAGKIALGERLFHDVRLSHGNAVACASCHPLEQGGDDGLSRSIAANGQLLEFNAPTIFNVAFNFRFNWRGNFRTLEAQNEAALLDDGLMGTNWGELTAKLGADPDYAKRFNRLYGTRPERANVLDVLAAYQRSLVTPNARFDRYLRGDRNAITTDEEHGYQLFKAYGCIACHQGANVGGNLFQKFGIFSDPFAAQGFVSDADLGRFSVTGRAGDRHVFRVPSLRNVAVTAPYFHDGRTASLEEAVEIMARYQLGRELAHRDIQVIVKFLGTLTGEYRGRPLTDKADRGPR